MPTPNLPILLLTLLAFSNPSICQKRFAVTIHTPQWMGTDKLAIFVDEGNQSYFFKKDTAKHDIHISYEYNARYGSIILYYPDPTGKKRDSYNIFWVGEDPAEIIFTGDSSGSDPLAHFQLRNAYTRHDMGADKLDTFQYKEQKEFEEYFTAHENTPDSLNSAQMRTIQERLSLRQLQFIRQNAASWYSLYKFRTDIARGPIAADTLLNFFDAVFPDSLRQSQDGQTARRILHGRLFAHPGKKAPDYNVKTLAGKTMSLTSNSGKYILLDFWATWCGPCREEMPRLRAIYEKYAGPSFDMISISLDSQRDRALLDAALRELKMTWNQVFDQRGISVDYNIAGIPDVFLIDPNGTILYRRLDRDARDHYIENNGIEKLESILASKLTKPKS